MVECKSCQQPLVLELDPEDFDEATSSAAGGPPSSVPDDLELRCSCHFHWQCLLDESPTVAVSLSCPACNRPISSQSSGSTSATNSLLSPGSVELQILAKYTNEGGIQPSLNLLPLITEEAYLTAHPATRPARALLTMCSEGDVGGIVELLQSLSLPSDEEENEEESMSPADLLRYQDPLDGMKSGLHIAVAKSQMEIIWLLLWLASGMPSQMFPQQAVNAANAVGAGRDTSLGGVDIRTLKTEQGETAGAVAERVGGMMAELLRAGIL